MRLRLPDDPTMRANLPAASLRMRVRAAIGCLRGKPVAFRLWFGEHPADARVSFGPRFCIIGCRFSEHHVAQDGFPDMSINLDQGELPRDEFMRSISRYVRNIGGEVWYGDWLGPQ